MLNTYTIVPAAERYAESYGHAVTSVALERKYLASTTGFPIEGTRAFVKELCLNNWPQYYAVAVVSSANPELVVGWCDIIPHRYEGLSHVGELGMGVVKEYRRQGIGKALLLITIEAARRFGLEKVELEVFASNVEAIDLYRKVGFTVEGVRLRGRKIDGVYDDLMQMGLFL